MTTIAKPTTLLSWVLLAPIACVDETTGDEVADEVDGSETSDFAEASESSSDDATPTDTTDTGETESGVTTATTGTGTTESDTESDTTDTEPGTTESATTDTTESDTTDTTDTGAIEETLVLTALEPLGTYATEVFDEGAAEIVDHHPGTQQLFVVNGSDETIDVLDISDPGKPTFVDALPITDWGASPNSLAIHGDLVAVAVEDVDPMAPGVLLFLDANTLEYVNHVTIGVLPDMAVFSPDGTKVLIACEGEPADDYLLDPEGSIAIVDVSGDVAALTEGDVQLVDFSSFSLADLDPQVRIFGPGSNVEQDLEPEYITVSADSTTAWVTLQENNAIAIVDIAKASVIDIVALGFKNHSQVGKGIDASDADSVFEIANWPVLGMYQPDAIASFAVEGQTYLITANEGDARGYDGFAEEARVADLLLDPVAFPKPEELQAETALGRLSVTATLGDLDDDGEYERLYAFGSRSVSVWSSAASLIWDSGEQLEQHTAAALPEAFNFNSTDNASFDGRSDDKGPEPEGLTVANLWGKPYAFVGLERIGGVMVFDLSVPQAPAFVLYDNSTRNFSGVPEEGSAGDLGPEGLHVIAAEDSPIAEPLLVVANEVSGTTTVYRIIGE